MSTGDCSAAISANVTVGSASGPGAVPATVVTVTVGAGVGETDVDDVDEIDGALVAPEVAGGTVVTAGAVTGTVDATARVDRLDVSPSSPPQEANSPSATTVPRPLARRSALIGRPSPGPLGRR